MLHNRFIDYVNTLNILNIKLKNCCVILQQRFLWWLFNDDDDYFMRINQYDDDDACVYMCVRAYLCCYWLIWLCKKWIGNAGFNVSIGSLAGAGIVMNSVATSNTLTASGDNTSTTFIGIIQKGSGTTALTKSGTLTLSGVLIRC